jgi:hypothetical protein
MGLFSLFRRDSKMKRAQRVARALRHTTIQQNLTSRTGRKKQKLRTVEWKQPLLLTSDALYCPVDMEKLPTGVDVLELSDEAVLATMEARIHAPVTWEKLPNGKYCYVARIGVSAQFPEKFSIRGFQLPPEAPPLAIPLGLDGMGEHKWVDLATLPHLLGIGATGKGKSNFVHVLLSTLIGRNTADGLEIFLADHKRGAELGLYEPLLRSKKNPGGIVRRFSFDPHDTIDLLAATTKEMERRLNLFRESGCNTLEEYGRQTGQYLPPLVFLIDEIFDLMLCKDPIDGNPGEKKSYTVAKWAEYYFARIASAGRAAGVHLAMFTQKTGKDVLTGLITANFESRIIFSLADQYQSIYVLGNADAKGMPRGRAIFRWANGDEPMMIQTPLTSVDRVKRLVERVRLNGPDGGLGRNDEAKRFRDDAMLLVAVACDYYDGSFARSKIMNHEGIRGTITFERFEQIGKRLQADGILEAGGPKKARRVAKGYRGRVQLLEQIYGTQGGDPTANREHTEGAPDRSANAAEHTVEGQQQATHGDPANGGNTAYGMRQGTGGAPANAKPDTDDPDDDTLGPMWRDVINGLDDDDV